MAKVVLSFKVRPEMKDELEKLAEADHRSLSNYIRIILRNHLQEKGIDLKKPKK